MGDSEDSEDSGDSGHRVHRIVLNGLTLDRDGRADWADRADRADWVAGTGTRQKVLKTEIGTRILKSYKN